MLDRLRLDITMHDCTPMFWDALTMLSGTKIDFGIMNRMFDWFDTRVTEHPTLGEGIDGWFVIDGSVLGESDEYLVINTHRSVRIFPAEKRKVSFELELDGASLRETLRFSNISNLKIVVTAATYVTPISTYELEDEEDARRVMKIILNMMLGY